MALVISDGITARVGSLTANKERFMRWNTIKNEDGRPLLEHQLEKVVRAFFDPEQFLNYMRYFVLFEDDGDSLIKKPDTISSTESAKPSASPRLRLPIPTDLTGRCRVWKRRGAEDAEFLSANHLCALRASAFQTATPSNPGQFGNAEALRTQRKLRIQHANETQMGHR